MLTEGRDMRALQEATAWQRPWIERRYFGSWEEWWEMEEEHLFQGSQWLDSILASQDGDRDVSHGISGRKPRGGTVHTAFLHFKPFTSSTFKCTDDQVHWCSELGVMSFRDQDYYQVQGRKGQGMKLRVWEGAWSQGFCMDEQDLKFPLYGWFQQNQCGSCRDLEFVKETTLNFTSIILAIFLNDRQIFDPFSSLNEQWQRCNRLFSSAFKKFISAKPLDQNIE